MKRVKIGDLVTCKLWLERELAVVVRYWNPRLVDVALTDGSTRTQYADDLVVLNESR